MMICARNFFSRFTQSHGRTTRGGHGLSKVSTGPIMPYPSMAVLGVARLQGQGGRPAAVFTALDTTRRTPVLSHISSLKDEMTGIQKRAHLQFFSHDEFSRMPSGFNVFFFIPVLFWIHLNFKFFSPKIVAPGRIEQL
jgi:hypothetical protein